MKNIKGNISAVFQVQEITENDIGEQVQSWKDKVTTKGFLDHMSGDSKYTVYDTKIQESTHIFICDFKADIEALKSHEARCVIKGKVYDVLVIDTPMELEKHMEIYLKFVG